MASVLLGATVLATAAPAGAVVRTTDGGDVPFYARITTIGNPDQIFRDGSWVAIVFYRPPDCVPGGFDLLTFFDFAAFGCVDPVTGLPATDGFNLWEHGPGMDPAPFLSVTHGLGAVPVWLVDGAALDAAMQDGDLLMDEVRAIRDDGLVLVGAASSFHQMLQPHDAAPVPMAQFVARGNLDDGRRFRVDGLFIEGTTIQTRIVVEGT